MFVFFFFSSRRRHTRCLSDWSSDVCSSDLKDIPASPRESDAARGAARVPTGSPSLGARAPAPAAPESTRAQSSREREVSSVVSEGTRNKQQGAVAAAPPAEAPPAA